MFPKFFSDYQYFVYEKQGSVFNPYLACDPLWPPVSFLLLMIEQTSPFLYLKFIFFSLH